MAEQVRRELVADHSNGGGRSCGCGGFGGVHHVVLFVSSSEFEVVDKPSMRKRIGPVLKNTWRASEDALWRSSDFLQALNSLAGHGET